MRRKGGTHMISPVLLILREGLRFLKCRSVMEGAARCANLAVMDLTNKSKKPLIVPLPGGKRLFLQPGRTGQVTPKALEHPPVVELLESGALESAEGSHGPTTRAAGKSSGSSRKGSPVKGNGGAARQSGDR